MSNKTKFTVNSSNGIKEAGTNVYTIECQYIDPNNSESTTRNVILTNKYINIFTKECNTITEHIDVLMTTFSTFDIDAVIAGEFEGYLIISKPTYDQYAELLQ